MKRLLLVSMVLAVMLLTVPGCGLIASKLPRVKLEPPSSESAQSAPPASSAPATAEKPTEKPVTPAAEPSPEPQVIHGTLPRPAGGSSGGVRYVPVGAQRTLTTGDLSGLSKWQLDVLRNEIYAAHGRSFDRSDLQHYFEGKTWYHPDSGFSEARLSSLEKRNAALIADYQQRHGQASSNSSGRRRRSSGSGSQWSTTGFVLPFSSSRVVTSSDLSGLAGWQLDIARNEIYARHGRPFKRSDLREYFNGQAWYNEDAGFSEGRLSSLEKRNAAFMARYSR